TSGPSGRAQRLEAYRAGAWEFLGQPVDGEALLLRLRTFAQSKLEVDALREDSMLDPATGFYNMRGLARRAREIGSEARRRQRPHAGAALRRAQGRGGAGAPEGIAGRAGWGCRGAGRSTDAGGRLARGELALTAPAAGPQGAQRLAERLGDVVAEAAVV